MPKGLVFWVLMLLWLIFGIWMSQARPAGAPPMAAWARDLLLFILLFLLGWAVFGFAIQ